MTPSRANRPLMTSVLLMTPAQPFIHARVNTASYVFLSRNQFSAPAPTTSTTPTHAACLTAAAEPRHPSDTCSDKPACTWSAVLRLRREEHLHGPAPSPSAYLLDLACTWRADCRRSLSSGSGAESTSTPPLPAPSKPCSGHRLVLRVMWSCTGPFLNVAPAQRLSSPGRPRASLRCQFFVPLPC